MAYNSTPSHWGPPNGIDSRDYVLLMSEADPSRYPLHLESHTLGSPSQDLSDPLTVSFTALRNDRMVMIRKTKRPSEEMGRTYTLGFPSALWTPALEIAEQGGSITRDFFMLYLSPSDIKYSHFYVYPEGTLDRPVEAGDVITVEDTAIINKTTTLRVTTQETHYWLGLDLILDSGNKIYAVATRPDVEDGINRGAVAAGGTGVANYGVITADRFATQDTITFPAGIPATSFITDVLCIGRNIYVTFADDADPHGAGAAGGVAYSPDGTNWTVSTGVTDPMYGLALFNGLIYAVGAGGAMYKSANGVTWDAVTLTGITSDFAAMAVDEDNSLAYLVGGSGAFMTMTTDEQVSDLSTVAGTGTTNLSAVHVLAPNHVAIGGAAGFYAESYDVDGGVWTVGVIGGASDAVAAISGTRYRVVAGAGGTLYERSLLTDMDFQAQDFLYGGSVTGDITDIAMNEGNDNFFLVGFDSGEVGVYKPQYPGA